jgi:hypothetical protein
VYFFNYYAGSDYAQFRHAEYRILIPNVFVLSAVMLSVMLSQIIPKRGKLVCFQRYSLVHNLTPLEDLPRLASAQLAAISLLLYSVSIKKHTSLLQQDNCSCKEL